MPSDLGVWDLLNILFRLGIIAIVIFKLWRLYDHYNREERFGLGVMGGCVLMTIPVILQGPASPFSEWTGTLFALGVLVYLVGRVRRTMLHMQRNKDMIRRAKERGIVL